jgi:hypothetical protein
MGAFAPKPAVFNEESLCGIWDVDDPKPIIQALVGRGLLESAGDDRFWLDALLVAHARSFLME